MFHVAIPVCFAFPLFSDLAHSNEINKDMHQANIHYYLGYTFDLKRTLLNYRVLGTNTTAIFLSNDHSLYASFIPYTSNERYA